MASGKKGWVSPDILSLNTWIWKAWNMSWSSTRPLSHVSCLHLWKESCDRVPPPEPFLPDLRLFHALDETYAVLVRHGLATERPQSPPTRLLAWRRGVMQTFEAMAEELKGFHPAHLPVYLARVIRDGAMRLPEVVLLAAFEAPAPIEEALFDSMAGRCALKRVELPVGHPEKTGRVVLPSRKQEVAWLTRQLVLDARTIPLNRIGIVVPDTETYVPHIKRAFREIMGESFDRTRSSYNIALGTPLLDRPLVQSGLLPLRFWVEAQPRSLLLSLLLSTYYGNWGASRDHVAQADCIWRKKNIDVGLPSLIKTISNESRELLRLLNGADPTLEEALGAFVQQSVRTGAEWVRSLETFWSLVGFPVTADESDTGAWRHFTTLLHRMREDLGRTSMSLEYFTALLQSLLSRDLVHIRGNEEAGIQVLGIIESRGLSFDKLYVLGLSAGSLPRPTRPLPFLDVRERHQVQGATAESQYIFGQEAFGHLLACAPDVTLIRPEEESAEPLAPSPFWAQVEAEEEIHCVIDPWNAQDSVWGRAAWLQEAKKGLAHPQTFPPDDSPVKGHRLPETISVSRLAVAFVCPFRFYAETILNLFPVDELIPGISPMDRGNRLHKALAFFTRRYRDQGLSPNKDRIAIEALLRACSDEALSTDAVEASPTANLDVSRHSLAMERRRWLGDRDGTVGLLTRWLDLELQRLKEGWRWLCEESPFEGLRAPGWPFSIVGRIDRVDGHEDKGIVLWDYKSGEYASGREVLEFFIDPQIPTYIMAAREGRIAGIVKGLGPNMDLSGGYIVLKKPSSVGHKALAPREGDWDKILNQWKEAVTTLGKKLVSGQFRAGPYPVSKGARNENACQYCPYGSLCNRKAFA